MDALTRVVKMINDVKRSAVSFSEARVTAINPLRVEGADEEVQLRALGWYDPTIGDQVVVARWGQTAVVVGSTRPNQVERPSSQGVVFTSGPGMTIQVTVDGQQVSLPFLDSYTPTVGDTVAVVWQETATGWDGFIAGKLGSVPTPRPAAPKPPRDTSNDTSSPPPKVIKTTGTDTVRAVSVATWRAGWRSDTPKVYQGKWGARPENHGFWFYGNGFSHLRGVTVTKAEVYLHALTAGNGAATPVRLHIHDSASRPSGEPAVHDQLSSPPSLKDNEKGWYEVSAGWINNIINGSGKGLAAIGSTTSHYTALSGLSGEGRDPMTGAVRITWERN